MRKITINPKKRDVIKAAKVKITADITGVSQRHVNRVIQGDNKNDEIIETYLQIDEGVNLLVKAVKEAVPL